MELRRHFGLIYGILVVLILALGTWWVVFLSREGRHYEQYQLQRLANDRLQAAYLIETVPEIQADPVGHLQQTYPHLIFDRTAGGIEVRLDPSALKDVKAEAQRRQRMFTSEGIFFLVLLIAAATILVLAYRSERDFKRARELFLAGATHEFKTPLASLRLYTETLDRPELTGGEASRIRRSMLADLDRLGVLINQVLALSHDEERGPGPQHPLDLGHEAGLVLEELADFLDSHRARVESSLPAGHWIRGDSLTFSLALRNLLHNAVRYSEAPAQVTLALTREGSWHRLAVSDMGPGIPRRERKKIFRCFYSGPHAANGRGAGAGLGLYLVDRNVTRLGGRVELDSHEGLGSTFTLVLPAHAGEEP